MKTLSLKKLMLFTASALVLGTAACSDDDDDDNMVNAVSTQDRGFTRKASFSNNAEIDAGNMAQMKGEHSAVRWFGEMMEMDHTAAQNDLENIAFDINADMPEGLDSMGMAMKAMLTPLSGHAFDSAYITSQVAAHDMTIALMETQIANGTNQRLKEYANEKLPIIQHHRHMADSIRSIIL